jgi:hypothetical protein
LLAFAQFSEQYQISFFEIVSEKVLVKMKMLIVALAAFVVTFQIPSELISSL